MGFARGTKFRPRLDKVGVCSPFGNEPVKIMKHSLKSARRFKVLEDADYDGNSGGKSIEIFFKKGRLASLTANFELDGEEMIEQFNAKMFGSVVKETLDPWPAQGSPRGLEGFSGLIDHQQIRK